MESNVEKWIKQITIAISQGCEPHIAEDGYPSGASSIVEPWFATGCEMVPEAQVYYSWMENDPDNWASFIKQNFGDEWGLVADIVNVEGY